MLSAVIFAFSLWLYVSMNNTYSIYLNIPLRVNTNEDQAIENVLPENFSVEIKGKGWDLFNAKYLRSSMACLLDISKYELGIEEIDFPYSKLTKNLRNMEQFEVLSLTPENVKIKLGKVSKEYKPLQSKISVNPRMGFVLVGGVNLNPNEVTVKGFSHRLDSLDSVQTKSLIIDDAYLNLSGKIEISDSLSPTFRINPLTVDYTAKIQLKSNVSFKQVPVRVRGGVLPSGDVLQPKYITVYLYGGVNELAKINPSEIGVYVDYDKLVNDSTGNIYPSFDLPNNISVLKTEPQYIYHYKYKNSLLK